MSADFLLLWMSARGRGSWAQFRAAVEGLRVGEDADFGEDDEEAPDQFALPLYQALRFNLQRAGHAEFFTGAGSGADWRVAQPSLAVTERRGGWLGVVVGARSLAFMERLGSATAESGSLQSVAIPGYPTQLLVVGATKGTLAEVADKAGLILQYDTPAAILTSLPPVDDQAVRRADVLPIGAGWLIDRFSPNDLAWHPATLEDAAAVKGGLFRFALRHQRFMLYCVRGAAFRIPVLVGKYLVLKQGRRQVLKYDRENSTLLVPARCRPPFLVERALILCSGLPPAYEKGPRGGVLVYREVSESIATISAALLRQELR